METDALISFLCVLRRFGECRIELFEVPSVSNLSEVCYGTILGMSIIVECFFTRSLSSEISSSLVKPGLTSILRLESFSQKKED